MKKEIKTIEKQVYIASDGKEFDNEELCTIHEESLKEEAEYEAAKKHIESLEIIYDRKDLPALIPLRIFGEENGNIGDIKRSIHKDVWGKYRYFRLRSEYDAQMLAKVMSHEDTWANTPPEEILKKSGKISFPCIGMYARDYNWGRQIGTFEKEMELVKKYCKLHGYDIELKKRKGK